MDRPTHHHPPRLLPPPPETMSIPYKTVTEIVRNKEALHLASDATIQPDRVHDIPIHGSGPVHLPPRRLGNLLHACLARSLEGGWVNRGCWPVCDALHQWLGEQGIDGILPELPLQNDKMRGVCDLLTRGGPRERGLVEWKICNALPSAARPSAVLQLGLYACLAENSERIWGAIAYICIRQRKIRIFSWVCLGPCAAAARLLAA